MRKNTHNINSELSLLIKGINNNNILTLMYLMSKYPLFSVESKKLLDGLVKGSGNLIGSPSSPNQWLTKLYKIIS